MWHAACWKLSGKKDEKEDRKQFTSQKHVFFLEQIFTHMGSKDDASSVSILFSRHPLHRSVDTQDGGSLQRPSSHFALLSISMIDMTCWRLMPRRAPSILGIQRPPRGCQSQETKTQCAGYHWYGFSRSVAEWPTPSIYFSACIHPWKKAMK